MKVSTLLLWGIAMVNGQAEELSVSRIYANPGLTGPNPTALQFAPDGSRITFLQGKEEEADQLDLWEYHIAEKQTRRLVDSADLISGDEELSDEEKARRERKRLFKSGIVDYAWSPDGKALLFPLNGDLYHYTLAGKKLKQLTRTASFETDPKFSPQGRYVSFVREQNLYVIEVASGKEWAITSDGGGTVKNGMAEFVAQEEMDRYTGYWWSEDETKIAFARIDEAPVQVAQRYEIYGESFKVYDQRYPATGTANVTVSLAVHQLANKRTIWMDLGKEQDIYLARVNWLPDSKRLAVQRQTRDQKILDVLLADAATGQTKVLLTETSKVWINLHHHLTFLEKSDRFIWGSERDGFMHLYLYDLKGNLLRQLTKGSWVVDEIEGVNEEQGHLYFTGNEGSPLEKHLFRVNLDGKASQNPLRLTEKAGYHGIEMSDDEAFFLDSFSNTDTPPRVDLYKNDGTWVHTLEENKLGKNHPYGPFMTHHSKPEFGTITAEDGQIMHYRIIKPKNLEPGKRYPVVVDVYGGPHAQRVKNSWDGRNSYWHQIMAQRGFVVFALDNRGSARRGTAFEFPIHRQLGLIEVTDQLAGVTFLKKQPYVDGDRIGVFGWSYGGYMTLMLMMKAPEVYRAGVSVAPVTDWALYDTHYTERYLGHPRDNADGYRASNVFPYIKGLKGALLNVHGMADDNVLFTNSTMLYQTLQYEGVPFQMMDYPGAKHSISDKRQRVHLFRAITQFFEKELKP